MNKTFSYRVRRIFKSMKVSVCGCHRNEDVLVAIDSESQPYKRPCSETGENLEESDSADEKLRSLGYKGHNSSKNSGNTYCGGQTGEQDASNTSRTPPLRSEAPAVPPPPIPCVTTNQIQEEQSYDQPNHEPTNQKRASRVLETPKTEEPPPIFPKPQISNMAERRLHRNNKKSGNIDESSVLKKRSRSEGPHGRRKMRNSMHETTNKPKQNKSLSNGRHSMYTGHLSDDDDVKVMYSGSDSPDSDAVDQRWTKNPLMVRKSRKGDKTSKTDKRRSVHNVDKNINDQTGPNSYMLQNKDFFIQPRKTENSQNLGQKARFLRMEENRKKRIDMAVTSDEECSPQLRINRLRQRAMMSSHMDNKQGSEGSINIVPVRSDPSFKAYKDFQNGISQHNNNDHKRLSQYDENRVSKYDENFNIDNMNENFYQEYTKQQGVKRNKLPNILPEFLPENRSQLNMSSRSEESRNAEHLNRSASGPNLSLQPVYRTPERTQRQNAQSVKVKLSSESPKLRSFNEVKTNQPTQLKKADQKIELNLRSPDSSSDSLDDLIESNIQYLESEIESGKLKRQSGNYSNYSQENVIQRQVVREPLRPNQIKVQDDLRSRLDDPRTYVSKKLMSTVTKVEPKVVQRSVAYPQSSDIHMSQVQQPRQITVSHVGNRHVPHSGSATFSPHMQRKTYVNEDISKSDSHLNALNSEFLPTHNYAQKPRSYVPYPVVHEQTGNIMYVQPSETVQIQNFANDPQAALDAGMFSDVEYNIEVSERIKKWEKKLTPGEIEERRKVLNTIKEYESCSDSNQKPDTPVEVRRELWQLVSPTSNSGVGKLSVNLTRSTSSISDSSMQDPSSATYFEPKVVSSETNLHRIFRVVNEPRSRRVVTKSVSKVRPTTESDDAMPSHSRYKKPEESSGFTQSLSNVTLSESEIGTNMQQTWPPMVIDSDSGIRKSWRMSRYEDEINELKELVSDNVRDIRKRFDSDVSETDTKRTSPVLREKHTENIMPTQVPIATQTAPATSKLTLNIQPVTPTNQRSPVTIRRKLSDHKKEKSPPPSPSIILTPKNERKVYRNVPIETKALPPAVASRKPTNVNLKAAVTTESKVGPDVWSPNMESRQGLVSMERVKARTLQTIPFSEDPVWKEIEGLATFERPEEGSKEVNFDEIDELLKLATGGMDNLNTKTNDRNISLDTDMKRLTSSDTFNTPSPAHAQTLMTQSYIPASQMQVPIEKQRKLSDPIYPPPPSGKHTFNPPTIQPLKLNSKSAKKSSTSALDEVLEDIRATLQKKPLSPKLMKNLDASESNSSANLSLQSPLTKCTKAFVFPKDVKTIKTDIAADNTKSATATPGYDNTHESWKPPPQNEIPPEVAQQMNNVPYIDPEFTQFPYIINGNYHLDPKLLSDKLKSTGLAHESSDEHSIDRNKTSLNFTTHQNRFGVPQIKTSSSHVSKPEIAAKPQKLNANDLDQSVEDLRSLAQEVEHKLSQIKSRIVSADEDRLDNILLTLRKFAPMTEQKFFNVKFTPNYESEKARRSKLEDALSELEKVYKSLDLDDPSLLDRASRREETLRHNTSQSQVLPVVKSTGSSMRQESKISKDTPDETKLLRRSQIDEIERQTQNEFEDITNSFQVLLDEVTKQCRTVANRSSKYFPSDTEPVPNSSQVQQYSNQRPADEIRQEPPRQQLKIDTKSQRAVQDSYNTAIKELESVASGHTSSTQTKPVQSVLYLNIDKSKSNLQTSGHIQRNTNITSPTRNIDIQIQSKTVVPNNKVTNSKAPSESSKFVSMATEFSLPKAKRVETNEVSATINNDDSANVEVRDAPVQGRGNGRFRKRTNVEHRKSMPAITRTVETQTVETQTDPAPTISEMKEKFEHYRKLSLQEMSSDSSPDFKLERKANNKAAGGNVDESDSSSSDEEPSCSSHMRRSFSCPDIAALLEDLERKEKEKGRKSPKVDKKSSRKNSKGATPKSVKQRHENKMRFRSLQKDDIKVKQAEISASVTSDDGFESPRCKPPVYPVWKYPGQAEALSAKKTKPTGMAERDFTKTASDTEQDRLRVRSAATGQDEVVKRRRSRSFGCEQDCEERPKSFHELVATFEQNPQRREKIRMSGLRKCASEDSMFIDFILQKLYHSESDLTNENNAKTLTASELKLELEMKVKK